MTAGQINKEIHKLFSDTSVSQSETRDRLEVIRDECDSLIATLSEADDEE